MPSDSEPQGEAKPLAPGRDNAILISFLAFFVIAFGVWVFLGGKSYRAEYAQATQGWRVGTTRVVEVTVVAEDKTNLGCASDHTVAGLRCGYRRNQDRVGSLSADKPEMLQPYATVGGDLLLGAGLWTAADLKQTLPVGRFSVVCNYDIKGVMKSARIRFDTNAAFKPMGKTTTVGTLADCVVPQ